MNKQIKVIDLCNEFEELLEKLQFSEDSMRRYGKVLKEFSSYVDDSEYSQSIGVDFLISRFKQIGGFVTSDEHSKDEMYYFRTIRSLAEYFNFGIIFRRKDYSGEIVWPEPFRECNEKFLTSKIEYGISYGSIKYYRGVLKDLIVSLDAVGIHTPKDIRYYHVEKFIKSMVGWAPCTVASKISCLRQYFSFLFLNEFIVQPLGEKIPRRANLGTRTKLPDVWSEEDIEKILHAVDLTGPNGKRDYAMILLAARLGLRVGDIKALDISYINWSACTITIVQCKTKQPLTLPMPDDVGWAIINYLKNGRPETDSTSVFVRHNPPYDGFQPNGSLNHIITSAVTKAGVKYNTKRSGFHTLRHSLATHLLQNGTGASTISDILGHTDPETVKHYLRVDLPDLRKCALDVEVMPYVR